VGDLAAGEALKAANKRFNARRASKQRAKQLQEAERRRVEADRELQPSLKAQCMARNPHWFSEAA
jgi:hypothetical protein